MNTYTQIKTNEQRHIQEDKHIPTYQNKRTKAHTGDKHIHTDQNKRTKAHTRRRYTLTHRSKQKNKGTDKAINTYTQIKTKK